MNSSRPRCRQHTMVSALFTGALLLTSHFPGNLLSADELGEVSPGHRLDLSKPCFPGEGALEVAFPCQKGEVIHAIMEMGDGSLDTIEYEFIAGQAVFEGDMILHIDQRGYVRVAKALDTLYNKSTGTSTLAFRWPDSTVYYTIDPALVDAWRVTDAIAHWESNTALKFILGTNTNYVTFRPGSGCSSAVGMQGGQQFIDLAGGCSTGSVIHEIGHAIGLWHEQSRSDRDNHILIHWGNITAGRENNFQTYTALGQGGFNHGPYDFGSIMHYGSNAFSNNGQPTITKLDGSTFAAQRVALSVGDINGAKYMYPPLGGRSYVWLSTGAQFDYQGQWGTGHGTPVEVRLGNFDNDDATDIGQFATSGNSYVWTSDHARFEYQLQWGSGHGSTSEVLLADFNGDGKSDVAQFSASGNSYVWLSLPTGDGFATGVQWGSGHGHVSNVKLGDFNGDKNTDVVQIASGNSYIWLSSGSSFDYMGQWGAGHGSAAEVLLADFNGDGKSDIAQFSASGNSYVWLSLPTGDGFSTGVQWGSGHGHISNVKLGDFNGDKNTDVVQIASGNSYIWLSNGSSFDYMGQWGSGHGAASEVRPGDFNGDERTDLAQFASSGNSYVWLSTGNDFSYESQWGTGHGTSQGVKLGDFNDDGKTDVVQITGGS